MYMKHLLGAAAALMLGTASFAYADTIKLEPGKATDMVLLPKFLGILVFDQLGEVLLVHLHHRLDILGTPLEGLLAFDPADYAQGTTA